MIDQHTEATFEDASGKSHKYLLYKIPAVAGREILCQWPLTALPKVGDYSANEGVALKMLSYVAVEKNGTPIRLSTTELVDNHVPDAVVMMRIEREMFKYNFGFFLEEKVLTFFERLTGMIDSKISEMLTASLQRSSPTEKRPSTN
jgi:hypothetical protein